MDINDVLCLCLGLMVTLDDNPQLAYKVYWFSDGRVRCRGCHGQEGVLVYTP
jgi:hypothetical protein